MNLSDRLTAGRSQSVSRHGSGFREKREHFDATDLLLWFLLAIGILRRVGLLSWLLAGSDKHQLFNSPRGLFRALVPRSHWTRPTLAAIAAADRSRSQQFDINRPVVSRAGVFPLAERAIGVRACDKAAIEALAAPFSPSRQLSQQRSPLATSRPGRGCIRRVDWRATAARTAGISLISRPT